MLARVVWTGLIVVLICVLLSVTFPGRRGAPAASAVVGASELPLILA